MTLADDMIRFSQKVIRYTHDHDQTGFMEDELHYDATLRNDELIILSKARVGLLGYKLNRSNFRFSYLGLSLQELVKSKQFYRYSLL